MIDLWFDSLGEALWWWRRLGGTLEKVGQRYKVTFGDNLLARP